VSKAILDSVLAGTWIDPDTGKPAKVGVRRVEILPSLKGIEGDLLAALNLGRRLTIVTDQRTRLILGDRVADAVRAMGCLGQLLVIDTPHADDVTVAKIRAATKSSDGFIAVGSGTINDLCKYSGALDHKPYAVFGTAPSMNGFTSANAAITVKGHKKSLPAQEPQGVFLDLGVLAAAPARLIRAGLGDSVCRATAQVDWLMAHLLRDQPYRRGPFDLLLDDEAALFDDPAALVGGNIAMMERLARTLVLSGFGMTIVGGSQPASQGEHLISHYAEMMAPPDYPHSFHGEQIAVATIWMAKLQADMIDGPAPYQRVTQWNLENISRHFGDELGTDCYRDFKRKCLDQTGVDAVNHRLEQTWPEIAQKLKAVMRAPAQIAQALIDAGAPTEPEAIGWTHDFFEAATKHARLIRDRYTFLDVAGDLAP
jgi:glycerol-1-phosphate dehydrogenase [NAD(P)+]